MLEGRDCQKKYFLILLCSTEASVEISLVEGKCSVVYSENITENLDDYFLAAPDRFYFSEVSTLHLWISIHFLEKNVLFNKEQKILQLFIYVLC